MRVWVTMGFFDDGGDGVVMELDTRNKSVREVLRFQPPRPLRVPSKGFTGATWLGAPGRSDLLLCGSAAVYRFDGATLRHSGTLELASFNDLHGISVDQDRLLVCNTGLDCIDVFDHEGTFLGSHSFEAAWMSRLRMDGVVPTRAAWANHHQLTWAGPSFDVTHDKTSSSYYAGSSVPFRLKKQRDYVHPNHVARVGDRLLVTCLQPRCVYDITRFETAFETEAPSHDGVVHEGKFWTTRVDGVVEARPLDDVSKPSEPFDVTKLSGVAGWCRGLLITDELMFVGFTEMRDVRGQAWDRAPLCETSTAVVCLDRTSGDVVRRFDLTDRGRHSKVFAIVRAP